MKISFCLLVGISLSLSCMLASSCSQQKASSNFETGRIMKVKKGKVEKVSKMLINRSAVGEGAFAEMASSTASAFSPGLIAAGTTKFASSTGSLMDSKVETVAKVRVRVKLDDGEQVVIFQNDVPGLTFRKGDTVIVAYDDNAGNVWPE